jgi:hypothetical protein
VYWVDYAYQGAVLKAPITGAGPTTSIAGGIGFAQDIAVDAKRV